MKLQIEKPYALELAEQFSELNSLLDQLKFGSRIEVPFYDLSHQQLEYLGNL